jgi:hypothetical protein
MPTLASHSAPLLIKYASSRRMLLMHTIKTCREEAVCRDDFIVYIGYLRLYSPIGYCGAVSNPGSAQISLGVSPV